MKLNDTNPFEQLANTHARSFQEGSAQRKVQHGVDANLGTVRMLGNIADVYLSRFVGTVMGMAGAKDEQTQPGGTNNGRRSEQINKNKRYPNQ